MEKFKLITMTDFVLNKKASHTQIVKYAKFLKQPLKLEMFVSCDDKGNVLFEYKFYFDYIKQSQLDNKTIEDLLKDDIEYFLTQNATKQFL